MIIINYIFLAYCTDIIYNDEKLQSANKVCQMKNWIKLIASTSYKTSAYACGILFVLFIFAIVTCCFFQKIKPRYEEIYSKNYVVVEPEDLSVREKMYVEKLIVKNKIIPVNEIYDKTLSYYDSLISVLSIFIAILSVFLGALGFVSWISLKGKIKEEIQETKDEVGTKITDEIQRIVSSDFYKTWLTTEVFGKYITENKDKLFPDVSSIDINTLVDKVSELVTQKIENDKKELILERGGE